MPLAHVRACQRTLPATQPPPSPSLLPAPPLLWAALADLVAAELVPQVRRCLAVVQGRGMELDLEPDAPLAALHASPVPVRLLGPSTSTSAHAQHSDDRCDAYLVLLDSEEEVHVQAAVEGES